MPLSASNPLMPEAAESAGAAALDLPGLIERCLGNLELVERILGKFQERFVEDLAELETVLAQQDREQVARVAHRMKGTSATVSAARLQQVAAEIEHLGRSARLVEIPACLEQLRREWQQYLDTAAVAASALETT